MFRNYTNNCVFQVISNRFTISMSTESIKINHWKRNFNEIEQVSFVFLELIQRLKS